MKQKGWLFLVAVCLLFTGCPDEGGTDQSDTGTTDGASADTHLPDTTLADTSSPDTNGSDTSGTDVGSDVGNDVVNPKGNGAVEQLEAMGSGLDLPFDAALSPDSTEIFYVSTVGDEHHLFKIDAANQTTQLTTAGDGFVLPLGIVTDGASVFVLDTGYEDVANEAEEVPEGAIFSVSTTGGAKSLVAGTEGYLPTSGDLKDNGDGTFTLFFTGREPTLDEPGLFSIPTGGGSVSNVATGGRFRSPSGVAVLDSGDILVADPVASDNGLGSIFMVSGSTATEVMDDLLLGQPAGIALSPDQGFLLISALDTLSETSVVHRFNIAASTIDTTYAPLNIAGNTESAGLHCAKDSERCVWSNAASATDAQSENTTGGAVYIVYLSSNPKP